MLSPFIKWVGGKRRQLPQIIDMVGPRERVDVYIEPFLGGGAVLLGLRPSAAVVCDVNEEIYNLFTCVQTGVEQVLRHLSRFELTLECYMSVRAWDRQVGYVLRDRHERAARFIYLNKTCFNGLWRVNGDGHFNVPYAAPTRVDYDVENIREVSRYLQAHVAVHNCSYEQTASLAAPGVLYYLDPPYVPVTGEREFHGYNAERFTGEDQERLAQFCREVSARGARFILSNSDCPQTRELYADFDVRTVTARSCVGGKNAVRKSISELLVTGR